MILLTKWELLRIKTKKFADITYLVGSIKLFEINFECFSNKEKIHHICNLVSVSQSG